MNWKHFTMMWHTYPALLEKSVSSFPLIKNKAEQNKIKTEVDPINTQMDRLLDVLRTYFSGFSYLKGILFHT